MLNQFIKKNLLEKRLEKIYLSEEEFLKAKVNYKKMNRIDSEEDLNLHMKKKLYSEKALKYNIELPPGNYSLIFSFVGYETKELNDINVGDNDYTYIDVVLNSVAQGLEEVVVTVDARRNTESSVLEIQRKSASLLDGISAQAFRKIGANDIASAVKNVPGVSVQGGKYVYVRGLGDRYSKSILNGVDIPGLDPDRNTIQMDLFPTNLLSNVLVIKSARADLPADFTGGVIDV